MVMKVMGHTDVRTAMRYQRPILDPVRETTTNAIHVTIHVTVK
jgi:hypothetical protein